MSIKHTNNFSTTLSSSFSNVATSMSLTTVTGAPTLGSGVTAYFTITDGVNYEIVLCSSAPSGTTYSGVTRAQQGTSAQSWSSGAIVSINVTADCIDRKLDAPASISTYQLYAGPTAAGGISQQISNSTPGYVLTSAGSSSLASFTNLQGLATLTVINDGAIIYSNGTAFTTLNTTGSTTRYLSNTGTNNRPAWAQIDLSNGVTGVLPAANGGTGINNGSNTLTLAGNLATSGAYASTFTMTGATSVTFPTSGTLATVTGSAGLSYTSVSGTSQALAGGSAYIFNNAAATTGTLPASGSCTIGDTIKIKGRSAAPWIIQANTGQTITYGSVSSSTAGTATSAAGTDSLQLVYVASNVWSVDWALSYGIILA